MRVGGGLGAKCQPPAIPRPPPPPPGTRRVWRIWAVEGELWTGLWSEQGWQDGPLTTRVRLAVGPRRGVFPHFPEPCILQAALLASGAWRRWACRRGIGSHQHIPPLAACGERMLLWKQPEALSPGGRGGWAVCQEALGLAWAGRGLLFPVARAATVGVCVPGRGLLGGLRRGSGFPLLAPPSLGAWDPPF